MKRRDFIVLASAAALARPVMPRPAPAPDPPGGSILNTCRRIQGGNAFPLPDYAHRYRWRCDWDADAETAFEWTKALHPH